MIGHNGGPPINQPLVLVAYGGGTDSTAILIEMVQRGEPAPFAILFADTGGEHPHTYAYIRLFSTWLVEHDYPPITIVRALRKTGEFESLEAMCLRLNTLPAKAFGFKTCSLRYKIEPQQKWRNNTPAVRERWARGEAVVQIVGYEHGEEWRISATPDEDQRRGRVINRYPLIDWKMDREACVAIILAAGLPLPGKSSCFYCPSMKKHEISTLRDVYPDLLRRALAMEANMDREKVRIDGLGRHFSWTDYIAGLPTATAAEDPACNGCFDGDEDLSLEDLAKLAGYIAEFEVGGGIDALPAVGVFA